jgi:uncharacterized protein (TIGR03067 family)
MTKVVLIPLVYLMMIGDAASAADKQSDADRIQGSWAIVREDARGKERAAVDVKGTPVRISEKTITVKDDEHKIDWVVSYTLDPSREPKGIVMTLTAQGSDKPQVSYGIYELNGDQLRLCYGLTPDAVPKSFKTEPKKFNMFTLRRVPNKE